MAVLLNDDVMNVVKSYVSDLERLNCLRMKYSNAFFTSGLQRKNHKQLEFIHSNIIEMIHTEFIGNLKLFNTLEIKENILNAMKHKSRLNQQICIGYKKMNFDKIYQYSGEYHYNYCSYDDNWKSWCVKETKQQKIKRIVNLLQRLCDIVNMKPVYCIIKKPTVTPNEHWPFWFNCSIEHRMLDKKGHSYYIEPVTKLINLMVYIVNKNNNKTSK